RLARDFPDITFVLAHAGMPEDLSDSGWQRWREGMMALAAEPNVCVKLSGLGTFVHAYNAEVINPIVEETVMIFGAGRCMFGSNFPVEKLWTDYRTLYTAFQSAVGGLSESEQRAILSETASRVYRL